MQIYNKLVRDRIPEIIENSGKKVNYRVLSKIEYKKQLKQKLLEEVNEFLNAKNKIEMKLEIADIMEVLGTIIGEFGFKKDFQMLATYKRIEKGGFSKRYFLESVED